ncbi:uncharacterized protein GGS22DRAFT_197225 [Annulohypoxylon maeteangense]|uniref:uncharacterized protein n=1 Tax=Annulohypoxylon maeteangense TaxID=1927788 RepID=UPI002008A0CF|nr:uncharacterized protein GGS22DRAFT_197225 [Annulohypoxylon maeteangense]KAI0880903.1 hypothetical protein GGS22DRAFT_197225 [Annulohypoxylon maeteangense]
MHLLPLLLLLLLPTTLAQTSGCVQNENCTSCGWYCNQGCDALLDRAECSRCLYCRRESSSCGFIDIADTWTTDPPSAEMCEACDLGCWCHGDWYCMDGTTEPPPGSPPTETDRVG